MTPDYIAPAVGLPLAAALWGLLAYNTRATWLAWLGLRAEKEGNDEA